MNSRLKAPVAASLLLAGCTAGKPYAPPVQVMPANFRSVPDAPPRADRPWWESYGDPQLNVLVTRALAGNVDIESALARVDRAQASASASRAAAQPSVSVDGSAVRTRQSTLAGFGILSNYVPDIGRTQTDLGLNLGASWELDLAGGRRRGQEAAIADLAAAVADVDAARVTVAAETVDAYLQLRTLQARWAIARDQAAAATRLEQLVARRFELRAASRREAEQAGAAAAAVRAQLPTIAGDIDLQLIRLSILAGEMPESDRHGLETPAPLPAASFADIGTPEALLRRRPDLIAAERRLAASHARIGAALAEYYPKLTLSGLFGGQSRRPGDLFSGPANVLQGGVGLKWRLFDFGRIEAEVAAARGAEREALVAFRASVLRAAEDVERAVVGWETAQQRAAYRTREVRTAENARRLTAQAYAARHVSLVELTDADRRVLEARDGLAVARGDMSRSVAAAWRAIGG